MTARTMIVYDPTAPARIDGGRLAPRLQRLQGARAGILDNGKPNAGLLMRAVAEQLKQRYGVTCVMVRNKPVAGPAPPSAVADLTRECDFVLVGSAD
jgi:hypothetical protein